MRKKGKREGEGGGKKNKRKINQAIFQVYNTFGVPVNKKSEYMN